MSGTPGDAEEAVMMDAVGPVVVEGPGCGDVELTLRTPRWSCPPVLSALPFVEGLLLAAG
ncbi:hypothetical protein ABZ622_41370 [Streptomyces sp. NPDC007164]|uniref:hypothetical protein n=1 Tax=Streptomyces sp. NPDC007164 TaxID=3156918 RepID=UPI0033D88110